MYIVVEPWDGEGPGVKNDRVDFRVVQRYDGGNGSKGIVRGVSFKDDLCIWNPMGQYWSSGAGFFEHFKRFSTFQFLVRPISRIVISE